jgi:hypothetical protein
MQYFDFSGGLHVGEFPIGSLFIDCIISINMWVIFAAVTPLKVIFN